MVAAPAEQRVDADNAHFIEYTTAAPGPLCSVTIVGDSVGIGAGRFSPRLSDHLTARGWGPVHGADATLDVRTGTSSVRAVTGTVTLVRPTKRGFLTAAPCTGDGETAVSSVNSAAGDVVANSFTAAVTSGGRTCLTASVLGHSLIDVSGWWTR